MMTPSQAVRYLRERAQYADLVRDAYLGADVLDAAQRFSRSAEFEEIARFIGNRLQNAVVLDLGAGAGAASYAFATRGARIVYAVEPDLSKDVGGLAIREIAFNLPVQIVSAIGEALPFPDQTIDVVFGRQVLHHTRDLNLTLSEIARVLRAGGVMVAAREHVVDNARQLQDFLKAHPIHALAGGESAFPLKTYLSAFTGAGFKRLTTLGPYESVINAFPEVRTPEELADLPRAALRRQLGSLGGAAALMPGVAVLAGWWLRTRRRPGRLYSFVAMKR